LKTNSGSLAHLWRERLRVQFIVAATRAQRAQGLGSAEFLALLQILFRGLLLGFHRIPPSLERAFRASLVIGTSCA
jgi:hypothetical protein